MRARFLSLPLFVLLAGAIEATAEVPVLLRYSADGPDHQVFVAGEWNRWDPAADRMTDADGDGIFEREIELAPGRYEYKFVVDDVWVEDPNARESVTNPYGSSNSVLYAGAEPEPEVYRIVKRAEESGVAEIREVLFTFRPERTPQAVFLAGTFNEWKPDAQPMEGPDAGGLFHVRLALPPGEHQYKFVADGVWYHDEANEKKADDGFGGFNSILVVDNRFPSIPLRRGDGIIWEGTLSLSPENVSAVRVEPGRVVVTARAHQGDVTGAAILFRRGGSESILPMRELGVDGRYVYFRGELNAAPDIEGRLGVVLTDGDSSRVLVRSGLAREADDARLLEINAIGTPIFAVPDWVIDGVFYQIFPDRFFNGNKKNDPDFREPYYKGKTSLPDGGTKNGEYYHLVKDWYDTAGLAKSPYRTDGRPDYFSFYGGDLEGVREKLTYLKDLGATVLYFNPLHTAKSNHKYDACNYREVDPHFGGDEAFRKLVDAAHEAGIRIVVDGVFNHTGNCHYAFADCREKGKESPYWSWYEWRKWPLPESFAEGEKASDYYDCWWGFGDLPNLNFDLSRPNVTEQTTTRVSEAEPNTQVLDEIRAAVRFWLEELGADGFRLDVANEVPAWVWKIFREEVRRVKPDALVIAELWGNAAGDLSALRFDATMNYRYFRDPCLAFFARGNIDAKTFDRQLAGGRLGYPLPSALAAMNLVGSHDTERFLTLAGGDTRRFLLAALFGATYVGVPHIYYGDEIGMEGGPDPDCRRPFDWRTLETPRGAALRDRVRETLAIRRNHPAFRRGEFRTLLAEKKIYAYARWTEEDRLVVALNSGGAPATVLVDPAALPFEAEGARDLFSGQPVAAEDRLLRLTLEPLSGTILEFPAAEDDAPSAPAD
ncbi:MAG: alpha-amylase family glycosyl hydrolase [Candidatus Eisenbacteria bacterium]